MEEKSAKVAASDSASAEQAGASGLFPHPAWSPVSTAFSLGYQTLTECPFFSTAVSVAYLPVLGLFALPAWIVPHRIALYGLPFLGVVLHLLVIEKVQRHIRGEEARSLADWVRDWGGRLPLLLVLGLLLWGYFALILPVFDLLVRLAVPVAILLGGLGLDLALRPVLFSVHEVVLEGSLPWVALGRSSLLGGGFLGTLVPVSVFALVGALGGTAVSYLAVLLLNAFQLDLDGHGFVFTLVMPLILTLLGLWLQTSWAVLHLERRRP